MSETKAGKTGNSKIMTLTTDRPTMVDAREGNTLFIVPTDDDGLKLMTEDPAMKEALAEAETVMDENRDLLHRLA
jgi:transcriptional regulator/antitoxin, MazE